MSDDTLLNPQPVFLSRPSGKPWTFAPVDLDLELRFQAEHQRWARNQIETMRDGISPQAYDADCTRFVKMLSVNAFAFGGNESFLFILSDFGLTLYLSLLAAKAGCHAANVKALNQLRRTERDAWDRLQEDVMRRDFPNRLAPRDGRPESPDGATPSPSTTEYGSSSPVTPGESPEKKSADSPAATS